MSPLPSLGLAFLAQFSPIRVSAGPDRVIEPPTTETVLEGSVRGLKHGELPLGTSFTWSQLAGPHAEILEPHTRSVRASWRASRGACACA